MDYLVFLTGLFLLTAGLGCLFLFRRDPQLSRWPMLALAISALGLRIWTDILVFAFDIGSFVILASAFLGSVFTASLLAFCLSPLVEKRRSSFVLKWAAIVAVFGITFISGSGNIRSPGFFVPLISLAFVGGWRMSGFGSALFGERKRSHPLVTAFLLTVIAATCLLPEAVEICYDVKGQGLAPERVRFLGTLVTGNLCSMVFCWIIWSSIYQENLGKLSRNIVRRRRIGTSFILAAALFTGGNGAWLAHWLGNQARQDQTSTLLSALHLGAHNIDVTGIERIEGKPEEIRTENYAAIRAHVMQVHDALPGTRFAYILGMRGDRLVFLVDAEDPSNTENFSPPGEPVKNNPEKWYPAFSGTPIFIGPYHDEWGVWFTAVVPIRDKAGKVVALLDVDYPAASWLRPLAARRFAAMGVTLSVALLLIALFSFHMISVETAHRVENLSERLSDAMTAAEFDTWECFPKPFKLDVGDRIAATLGWSGAKPGPTFRKVWRSIHPEDRGQLFNLVRQQGSSEAEVRLKDAGGHWLWFMLRGRIVYPNDGEEVTRLVGTILNIDERHRTALEIDKQRRFAQHVMESVPNGLAVIAADGVITYANPAFNRLARSEAGSLEGQPLDPLISNTGQENPTGDGFEAALNCPDGTSVPVRVYRAPLREADQNAGSILAVVDLTAAKEAELNLLRSRAEANRLALVAKRTDNAVVITDAQGRIEWVNEGFTKISGYGRDEVMGRTPGSILQHPDRKDPSTTMMRERIREGKGFETEILNYAKDGRAYLVHIECQPLIDRNGQLSGFMAIERDITQMRRSSNLLEAVASISTTLLSKRIEPSIWGEILAALGNAANVDRCYLFQIHTHPMLGTPAMSQFAEWNSGSATPQIHNPALQDFPFEESGYSRWYRLLSEGQEISGVLADFPPEEQPMLIAQEIRSLAIVPIFTNDQLWGFLGFDACNEDRIWENWEISILRSAAANLGLRQVAQNESDALVLARDEAHTAASAAEKANQAKSTFLATMSHEIRTPLNAVIGMASLLETTPLNSQQQDFAETILSSSNFLLELINDILDYSRIESGRIDLDSTPFDLSDICREAFDVVRPGAMGKQIELIARIAPLIPERFMGDPARIRQILINLLSNAVKFTNSGFISLTVDGSPSPDGTWYITLEVKDSGIGIARDSLHKLFNPFVQEDSSTTRRFGGSGLGLAISKRIANLLGGDITVISEQGLGSTFLASIRLASISPDPTVEDSVGATAVPGFPDGFQPRILIVDDNEINRRILEEILAGWGLSCHTSASGILAIQQWNQSGPYDLVITDQQMPEMDGIEMTRYLRTLPDAAHTRFSLLSSGGTFPTRTRALFDEVGTKPIWPSTIHGILARLFPGTVAESDQPSKSIDDTESERLSRLRILVAEDNANNQKVIRLLLRRLGIEPDIVSDGRETVEAAAKGDYDIILIDIQMPLMDGIEASRRVRALGLTKRPFIIALTANVFQEIRDSAAEAGMDEYLPKPITLARLREMLCSVTASRQDGTEDPSKDTGLSGDASIEPDLIDLNILQTLAMLGRQDFVEIIEEVATSVADYIKGVHTAIAGDDCRALSEILHKFRGMTLQIGCSALPSRLKNLEDNFESITPDHAAVIAGELRTLWSNSLAAIREWEKTVPGLAG